MAATPQFASPDTPRPGGVSSAMTRCECAGVSFAEIARRMREDRTSLEEICGRTGCGHTCTACLPDLTRYLGGPE